MKVKVNIMNTCLRQSDDDDFNSLQGIACGGQTDIQTDTHTAWSRLTFSKQVLKTSKTKTRF